MRTFDLWFDLPSVHPHKHTHTTSLACPRQNGAQRLRASVTPLPLPPINIDQSFEFTHLPRSRPTPVARIPRG